MTGRAKNITNRIEVDIEKNREDSNWAKVIELAEHLKEKSPEYGKLDLIDGITDESCSYFSVFIRFSNWGRKIGELFGRMASA